jgi:hypothetical protein
MVEESYPKMFDALDRIDELKKQKVTAYISVDLRKAVRDKQGRLAGGAYPWLVSYKTRETVTFPERSLGDN